VSRPNCVVHMAESHPRLHLERYEPLSCVRLLLFYTFVSKDAYPALLVLCAFEAFVAV